MEVGGSVASAGGPHGEAFGHTGLGWQMGFADPGSEVSVAPLRSHLADFLPGLGGGKDDQRASA